jgi:speckle-type POZ protein
MSNSAPSSDGDNSGGAPSRSASAIVAKAVAGSHDLKIKGYSLTKGMGNCKFINSFVGGHRWCLRYYPNGCRSSDPGWVCFILFVDDNNDAGQVDAEFKVGLIDHDGKLVPSYSTGTRKAFNNKLAAPINSYGIIRHMDLGKSVYLKDDAFSVRCDLTVLSILAELARPSDMPAVPPTDMHLHFGQLLSGGEGTDVTLEVGTETFSAQVCARCSVIGLQGGVPRLDEGEDGRSCSHRGYGS